MNADHDLERRLTDFYATEAPQRAPDRVLEAALATTDTTRQRRALVRVPWRYPNMNGFARYAVAAVAVIAIGVVGFAVLRPDTGPGMGGPAPTASPSSIPTASLSPSPSPPSASGPALTETFTSTLNGISMSYPEGWTTQAATKPWTRAGPDLFREPTADFIYDPTLIDHLFLTFASRPVGDSTPEEWVAENVTLAECAASQPIAVDGATGLIGADDCNAAAVTTDGRGYIIVLYTSADEAWLATTYDRAWFEEVLATVRLHPDDAVDVAPSASPGPS